MGKVKLISKVYGYITPAQVRTLDMLTRNTGRDVVLPAAFCEEVEGERGKLEDVPRTRYMLIATEDRSVWWKIHADGRWEEHHD